MFPTTRLGNRHGIYVVETFLTKLNPFDLLTGFCVYVAFARPLVLPGKTKSARFTEVCQEIEKTHFTNT